MKYVVSEDDIRSIENRLAARDLSKVIEGIRDLVHDLRKIGVTGPPPVIRQNGLSIIPRLRRKIPDEIHRQ